MCRRRKPQEPESLKALKAFRPKKLALADCGDDTWHLKLSRIQLTNLNHVLASYQNLTEISRTFTDPALRQLLTRAVQLHEELQHIAQILAPIIGDINNCDEGDIETIEPPSLSGCLHFLKTSGAGRHRHDSLRECLTGLHKIYSQVRESENGLPRKGKHQLGFVAFAYHLLEKAGKRPQSENALASLWQRRRN